MTRDEILAMELPELSIEVAERVFNARLIGNDQDPIERMLIGDFGKESFKPLNGSWRNVKWRNSDEEAWLDCPKYAEDISSAWQVVEKLGELFAVRKTPKGYIGHVITKKNEEAITCKTAPEAICKVALLVMLEE